MKSIDIKSSLMKNKSLLSKVELPVIGNLSNTGSLNLDNIKNKLTDYGCGRLDTSSLSKLGKVLDDDITSHLDKLDSLSGHLKKFEGFNLDILSRLEELGDFINNLLDDIDFNLNLRKLEFNFDVILNLSNRSINGLDLPDFDGITSDFDLKNKIKGFELPDFDFNLSVNGLLDKLSKIHFDLLDLNLSFPKLNLGDFYFSVPDFPDLDSVTSMISDDLDDLNLSKLKLRGVNLKKLGLNKIKDSLKDTLDALSCVAGGIVESKQESLTEDTTPSPKNSYRITAEAVKEATEKAKAASGSPKNSYRITAEAVKAATEKISSNNGSILDKVNNLGRDLIKNNVSANTLGLPSSLSNPFNKLIGSQLNTLMEKANDFFSSNSVCDTKSLLKTESETSVFDSLQSETATQSDFMDSLPSCLKDDLSEEASIFDMDNPFESLDDSKALIKEKINSAKSSYIAQGKDIKSNAKNLVSSKTKELKDSLLLKGTKFAKESLSGVPGMDKLTENLDLHGDIKGQIEGLIAKKKEALIDRELLPSLQNEVLSLSNHFPNKIKNKIAKDYSSNKTLASTKDKLKSKLMNV